MIAMEVNAKWISAVRDKVREQEFAGVRKDRHRVRNERMDIEMRWDVGDQSGFLCFIPSFQPLWYVVRNGDSKINTS